MVAEHYIVCGNATAAVPAEHEADALRLQLYGEENDHKITLEINDIRQQMYKEVPERFRDLLDLATYVFAADQALKRGARDVETFGGAWRRRFRFTVPVSDLDFWCSGEVRQCLRTTLGFLSDDQYEFEFTPISHRPSFQAFLNFNDEG